MIEIVVSNKERVVVDSFDEAVKYLMSCCVKRPKSKKAYMRDVARRCEMYFGKTINYKDAFTFLQCLVKIGQLKEVRIW